jgi:Protein of unknown function (DUF3168)
MSIESAIVNLISASQDLTALIGSRLYPLYRPQAQRLACVVYQQVGGSDTLTTAGPLRLYEARFQFTCFAPAHADCVALAAALRMLLEDCDGTVGDIVIQETQVTGPIDLPVLDPEAEQLNEYARTLDCTFSYNTT